MSLTRGPATVCARMDFELLVTDLGDGIACVGIAGEVDLLAAPVLRQSLMDVVDAGGRRVVVDFSEATFVDSTVLGVLVGANKRLRARGGLMVLVCGSSNIRTIFEITLLDRVFDIVDSRDAALSLVRRFEDDTAVGVSGSTG